MENGKCAIARGLRDGVGFGSTEFHVVRASPQILPEWVYYYWRLPGTRLLAERNMTGTAGQKRVPPLFLETLRIPLPSVERQGQIVGMLQRADHLRRIRRYVLEIGDMLLSTVFIQMFGDPILPKTYWQRLAIEDFASVQTGNTPPRADSSNYGSDIEWIKSDNISLDRLHPEPSKEMLSKKGLAIGRSVPAGSILMTCIAGSLKSIGNLAISDRQVSFNQQINAITPKQNVDIFYLYALLRVAKPLIQSRATEAMKRMITKSKLEEIVLPIPPIEAQEQFSSILQGYMKLRATHAEALRQADHLFQTILNEAFNTA
jgi:type I restriction enzyme S subunit